jgi:hypothetical protein
MSTGSHIEGSLRDTLSRAVALVSDVKSAIVHKPLTEFEPISRDTEHLHVFHIIKGNCPGNRKKKY